MKHVIMAALSASAFLVAGQAHATDYLIDNSQPGGLGDPSKPFYVKVLEPTYVEAVIQGIKPPAGSFTDSFTFFLPFAGFGSGAVISTNLGNVDLQTARLDVYKADGVTIDFSITDFTRTIGGLSVSLAQNGNLPANVKTVLTVTGNASGSATYNGNISATAVPEASTWALMLAGFGAVGFAMRRRRAQQTVAVRFA